jgi:hypothetical protein
LVKFVSEFLHRRLTENIDVWLAELYSARPREIHYLVDLSQRAEAQERHLQLMRNAKLEKQNKRKAQYEKCADQLHNWRMQNAKNCLDQLLEQGDEPLHASEVCVTDDGQANSPHDPPWDPGYERDPDVRQAYLEEVQKLSRPDRKKEKQRRYAESPLSMQFAFLLSSISERALNIARYFLPLPGPRTVFSHYHPLMKKIASDLTQAEGVRARIEDFVTLNNLTPESPVSVSCDAMAMNADGSTLPAEDSQDAFVIYGQPLDRRQRCMPLHVIPAESGQARQEVQDCIDSVCDSVEERGLNCRFVCSDGDRGYNPRHAQFFDQWYPEYLTHGLAAALKLISHIKRIPASDPLHIWKQFLARVKNHPVTLTPDCLDHLISAGELEDFLHLGAALKDKSSIGKMRDCYALQFFTMKNCLKCLELFWIRISVLVRSFSSPPMRIRERNSDHITRQSSSRSDKELTLARESNPIVSYPLCYPGSFRA